MPEPEVGTAVRRALAARRFLNGFGRFRGAKSRRIRSPGWNSPEIVYPAGPDLWVVVTRRSMDAPAPGDWTLEARRDAAGNVTGVTLGCWLARGIGYARCP